VVEFDPTRRGWEGRGAVVGWRGGGLGIRGWHGRAGGQPHLAGGQACARCEYALASPSWEISGSPRHRVAPRAGLPLWCWSLPRWLEPR